MSRAEGIDLQVPGWRHLRLTALVLDVNGVLSLDGDLLPAVPRRVAALRQILAVHFLSADAYGRLDAPHSRLRVDDGEGGQKAALVRDLGADSVVAIGNGANDVDMLREAGLGIAVLGHEGAAAAALLAADVVAGSVEEALDLLLSPTRLVSTLRR